ncbi:DNA cytosine methyltransferase [Acidithiobacillus sp. CV18-2]|nr:DNA cytosine methyltransferase [Acidithiobacillus sp. CV18-3]MBU2757501.1 DNA cytosine methyltransferase [Acidithiobacillus sp. BN09-2]MBU2777217.1 DNA cytosine methyltransferase [Acidithiobacillus sp. CV18-2]MBU2799934.1 DNA cytosine methyltransferase [Acidithiobacillus sp. VAN18-4]
MMKEVLHFHLFCGLGGGAAGFNRGHARVGAMQAKFRCIGGVDSSASAIADFTRLAGVPGTVLDLFDRDQYRAFHGKEPPQDWREATPADIRKAAGGERPHIVFTSPPCKGFSGLLSQAKSQTEKYKALDRLTLRGIWLTLEAWSDDPPEFIILENVPRIQNRGRYLLDQIGGLLRRYGYAVAETTHDCGELGGLAQSRKRFLLVARHMEKVQPFLYEPSKHPLLSVGDVLGRMPIPGNESNAGGAMHRVPSLQWKTWVRLAFVEAGSDWRSLDKLVVQDGFLRDYLILPERRTESWRGYAVADPRFHGSAEYGQYGVRGWEETMGAVSGQSAPGGGRYAVADPRPGLSRGKGDNYLTAAHYGVVSWKDACGAVSAAAGHDNGKWSVADPRTSTSCFSTVNEENEAEELPDQNTKLVAMILALDDTWHRPFTTLELAALQGLVDPEEYLELDGLSDRDWRERIGNAVPPPAAQAIASVMGKTLLLAWAGETFVLDAAPIWVKPMAMAVCLDGAISAGQPA